MTTPLRKRAACELIGISTAAMDSWLAKGYGPPSYMIGGIRRWDKEDIQQWITEQKLATLTH